MLVLETTSHFEMLELEFVASHHVEDGESRLRWAVEDAPHVHTGQPDATVLRTLEHRGLLEGVQDWEAKVDQVVLTWLLTLLKWS